MDYYKWNKEKNERLKTERGISFEQITMHVERGDLVDIATHPNQSKYPNQQVLVVEINDYVYLVPFVEEEIQAPAVENGIPYQTLMYSVLHRCGSGYLIEKPRPNESFESDA